MVSLCVASQFKIILSIQGLNAIVEKSSPPPSQNRDEI